MLIRKNSTSKISVLVSLLSSLIFSPCINGFQCHAIKNYNKVIIIIAKFGFPPWTASCFVQFFLFFFFFLPASLTITKIYSYQHKKLFTWWRHFITTTKILVQIRVLFIWTSLSLRANPPFGGVARSHSRAARYRRRECEGLRSPWLESLHVG